MLRSFWPRDKGFWSGLRCYIPLLAPRRASLALEVGRHSHQYLTAADPAVTRNKCKVKKICWWPLQSSISSNNSTCQSVKLFQIIESLIYKITDPWNCVGLKQVILIFFGAQFQFDKKRSSTPTDFWYTFVKKLSDFAVLFLYILVLRKRIFCTKTLHWYF